MSEAEALANLEQQVTVCDEPRELLALAMKIDELGLQLARELTRLIDQPELAAPLKPVLLRAPVVYTRTLLRAAEKLDDAGSPRRAARVLIEALRKARDARMIDVVADALAFTLDAFDQRVALERLRALVLAASDASASRRELGVRYLAAVDELPALVDWAALDDELGLD